MCCLLYVFIIVSRLKSMDTIPADCVLLFHTGKLHCDESTLQGESDVEKSLQKDPFLLGQTSILSGDQVVAVVTAVGASMKASNILENDVDVDLESSPLQLRLDHLSNLVKASSRVMICR